MSKAQAGTEPQIIGPKQYRCEMCGGVFRHGWSDEDALAELAATFPGFEREDCALVCDDCFKAYTSEKGVYRNRS